MALGGALALLQFGFSAHAAGILGDSVQVIEYYPAVGDIYGPIAGPDIIPSGGFSFGPVGESDFTVTVYPTQIDLNGGLGLYCCSGYFNGFYINDLTTTTTFTGVSLITSGGLPVGNLSFDAHDVIVNLADVDVTGPIVVDFATTGGAVPEPATWALMLTGFMGLGFAGYRKARASGRC